MGQNVEPLVLVLEDISTQIVRDVSTKRLIFGWKDCLFTRVILDDRHIGYQTTSVFVDVSLEIKIQKACFFVAFLVLVGERHLSYVALVVFQLVGTANVAKTIVTTMIIVRASNPGIDGLEAVQTPV